MSIILDMAEKELDNKGVAFNFRLDGDIFNVKRLQAKSKITNIDILDLLFADDTCFCAERADELQMILDKFNQVCKRFGLIISTKKTYMIY